MQLGCRWHTVKRAIERGELNVQKVGRTWAVVEDEALSRFRERLEGLSVARKKRSVFMKSLWRNEPSRVRYPPRKRIRLSGEVTYINLVPLRELKATPTETNSAVCPHCRNRVGVIVRVTQRMIVLPR